LKTLSVYADSTITATNLFVGLYSDVSGHPGTLLTSSSTAKFQKAAWNTIPVAPVGITAGTRYWFSLLATGGNMKFRQRQGAGGWIDELNSVRTLTSLPAKWTSGTIYSGGALTSVYGSGVLGEVTAIPPVTTPPATAPVLAVNATSLSFTAQTGTAVSPEGLSITNTGTGTLTFTGSSDQTWLGLSPASGTAPANLTVSPSMSGLKAGTYTGHVTLAGGGTTRTVTVTLTVTAIQVAHSVALAWKADNSHRQRDRRNDVQRRECATRNKLLLRSNCGRRSRTGECLLHRGPGRNSVAFVILRKWSPSQSEGLPTKDLCIAGEKLWKMWARASRSCASAPNATAQAGRAHISCSLYRTDFPARSVISVTSGGQFKRIGIRIVPMPQLV
jgi:Viral BACON domain